MSLRDGFLWKYPELPPRGMHSARAVKSQFAATSAPRLLAASGWAQSSGLWPRKVGLALGVKVARPVVVRERDSLPVMRRILHVAAQAQDSLPMTEVPAT